MELFGSSANGFGSHHSDLDLCMMMEDDQEVGWSHPQGGLIPRLGRVVSSPGWPHPPQARWGGLIPSLGGGGLIPRLGGVASSPGWVGVVSSPG